MSNDRENWMSKGKDLIDIITADLSEVEKRMVKAALENAEDSLTNDYSKKILARYKTAIETDRLINEAGKPNDYVVKDPHLIKTRHAPKLSIHKAEASLYTEFKREKEKRESNRKVDPNQAFRRKRKDKG